MKRSYHYRERDYTFGNLCVTLRTTIGVNQAGLASVRKNGGCVSPWHEGGLVFLPEKGKRGGLQPSPALCLPLHSQEE